LFYLVKEPRAEDDLNRVVNDQSAAKLEGWSVFHVGRSPHFDEHDVTQANSQGGQRRAHKEPVLHSPVCWKSKREKRSYQQPTRLKEKETSLDYVPLRSHMVLYPSTTVATRDAILYRYFFDVSRFSLLEFLLSTSFHFAAEKPATGFRRYVAHAE
jgi:hypothetical protein